MLKKIITALLCYAMLANASMIASAEDSYAENTAATETEVTTVSEEATISDVEDTTEESSSAEEIGESMRKSLGMTATDIVYFDDMLELYDQDGNVLMANMGSRIYLIGIDDENQRFRVYAPKVNGTNVTWLLYQDAEDGDIVSNDGMVVGDLDMDQKVNVFDMCLMRRGFIYGWDDKVETMLADMNNDGETTIADLVWLQSWLLGKIK